MALQGIKALVTRLHTDENLLGRFASDPESVLREYKLTAAEKRAMRNAHLRIQQDGSMVLNEVSPTVWWMA